MYVRVNIRALTISTVHRQSLPSIRVGVRGLLETIVKAIATPVHASC
jgi:hypothetical protein